ncbi:NOL1/NOP2/sun family putative RNA methylase [Candidatus Woesearchaeota archaeon]|nr:NOL1/NOP2/sun family putative RNA methylase [Candidatus Woesearchaeota archaeon]
MRELKHIPDSEKLEFKKEFIERYSKLTDFEEFKKYSLSFLDRCIRVNTIKISVEDLVKRLGKNWNLKQVPWCKQGFWIEYKGEEKRRDIGNLIEHSLGYIYVQEAVSMIPPIVLDAKPGDAVLDMCSSPGSKATQIAAMMKNQGMLVANDFTGDRMKPLGLNIRRCGVTNAVITLMKGQQIKLNFDKILVDAPCSGTGTIRKSLKTIRMWSPYVVKRLAGIQKQLIENAFNILKPGGTMVYSTCTLEPEEDEAVVSYLLDKYDSAQLRNIELNIKRSKPVMEFNSQKFNSQVEKCLRIWPQDNNSEGFFVTKIKKLE